MTIHHIFVVKGSINLIKTTKWYLWILCYSCKYHFQKQQTQTHTGARTTTVCSEKADLFTTEEHMDPSHTTWSQFRSRDPTVCLQRCKQIKAFIKKKKQNITRAVHKFSQIRAFWLSSLISSVWRWLPCCPLPNVWDLQSSRYKALNHPLVHCSKWNIQRGYNMMHCHLGSIFIPKCCSQIVVG